MKIRIVNSRDEIAQLDPKETVIHLIIVPTTIDLLDLINRCPSLATVELPPYRFRNMCKSSRCLLELQGVKIFLGVIQGHRTDLSEYCTFDNDMIIQRAREAEVSPGW